MDAIFFVLRTGCQWGALDATGLCAHSAAHRRFQAWTEADVFVALREQGLGEYDALQGMDWEWLEMDDAMPKAPLGEKRWAGAGVAAAMRVLKGSPRHRCLAPVTMSAGTRQHHPVYAVGVYEAARLRAQHRAFTMPLSSG